MRSYSAGLFLGTPFSLGAVTAYFYNWKRLHSLRNTFWVVFLGIAGGSLALLAIALEGVICIVMAAPLALAIAWSGAVVGREMARRASEDVIRVSGVLVLATFAPGLGGPPPPLHEVVSVIEVNAPPDVVWQRVVAFGELTEPPELIFRLGVAYPVRATISGTGAGAVRRCEFSTGAFVEPITVWDAPRRLAFDVVEQPRPLYELSPYDSLRAPHLAGVLVSKRGEFRLVELPGGRTRLEGSTWYTLAMGPLPYWRPIADAIIHRIHLRVLRHVRGLAEADGRSVS